METLAAPGGGLALAASVADVAALVAELIAVFAVSVAELAFSEADLSLEQPVSPPITIAVHPTATTNARSTTLSPLCCIRCFGKPIHLPFRPTTNHAAADGSTCVALWLENDLDGAILLLLKDVVAVRCLIERQGMRGEGVDAQRVVVCEERHDVVDPFLHVGLTHSQLDLLVEQGEHR